MGWVLILIFFSILSRIRSTYGYDPLDPNGNVTIKWDLMLTSSNTHNIRVSIYNYQLYRHVEEPGWKLSWLWQGDEVIWAMQGAEAMEQGNCSKFQQADHLPHCCEKRPHIVDLLPGTPYNKQSANCCKGGVLTSMAQEESKSLATFEMVVGGPGDYRDFVMPVIFSLGVPGYSCSNGTEVKPSKFETDRGRRKTQALATWVATCTYSQYLSSPSPKCCVALSTFYSSTITNCQTCSCSCQSLPGSRCINNPGENPLLAAQKPGRDEWEEATRPPVVWCSRHMCPIRVHWHIKQSYREYWRVKVTITNMNFIKNYSNWNLVMLHPNLKSVTQIFSFNYRPLNQHGHMNDSGVFWGLQFYNDMLLQAGETGNVQSEMLLHKDPGEFTFKEGWAFPRRVLFNGDECVMPAPDDYPRLPGSAPSTSVDLFSIIFFTFTVFLVLL